MCIEIHLDPEMVYELVPKTKLKLSQLKMSSFVKISNFYSTLTDLLCDTSHNFTKKNEYGTSIIIQLVIFYEKF